ncbi:MAG TPA: sorbosone dehydrogenase family protein, partial [Steroidobacteraceae bacterium]
ITRGVRRAAYAVAFAGVAAVSVASPPDLSAVKLPPGFRIETYVAEVPFARSMAMGEKGTLFVGSMRFGTRPSDAVYAVRTVNGERKVSTLLKGLNNPNGVAVHDGDLYVAEIHRITRYDDIESNPDKPPKGVEIAKLPAEQHHGWRYIAFGPDNKLYVAIGAPCNVCDRDKEDFATIIRMNADGSGREVVARGVRNSVGFTWHPTTKELWFTDNGRDMMGDDVPDCELNRLARVGDHFGFPACHAGDVPDPEFGKLGPCSKFVPPVLKLGPHVAPLAVKFYTGTQFPAEYRGQMFIAQHGSWNRSKPIGYRIMRVKLDGNRVVEYEPFVTGWLGEDGKVTGRPVDILQMPDGSLLVSDDHVGAIYRISYSK